MSANPNYPPPSQPPKLLDQLRGKARLLHYSKRTEDAYADWATKFILFHGNRHPREMGTAEVAAYLTYLAVERKLAANTQNQAFAAILFLYRKVLEIELDRVEFLRVRRPERLPVVLAVEEVRPLRLRVSLCRPPDRDLGRLWPVPRPRCRRSGAWRSRRRAGR